MISKNLISSLILVIFLFLVVGISKVLSLSLSSDKYTIFKTENQGFKFYTLNNKEALYSRDSSKDLQYSIDIKRLACDQTLNDECGREVSNSNVGAYAYDIVRKDNLGDSLSYGFLFKGYVRYQLPPGKQPARYIRDPSMDIIVTTKAFSASPWQRFPYYGDYKVYKRAPCDLSDLQSYECQNLGVFRASSTENILYDLQFSNPFRVNNVREGTIGFYAQAFSVTKPVFSFSKLFAQSPQIDSEPNQVVTNEVFRQLLISSLYRQDYFELLVDHNLWIEPSKDLASIIFKGSSPYQYLDLTDPSSASYTFGYNCPAGENNFPCKNEVYVFGFPVYGSDNDSGYFFRDFIRDYFNGQVNQFISMDISGRSGDWNVKLCFDNNLKKVYGQVIKIRDEDHGNGNFQGLPNQGYEIFSNGKIRLTVDTNDGPGDIKIYLKRIPFVNRTCANLGGFQELISYSW